MRKTLFAVLLALLCAGCQSKHKKAINEYMQGHLNDPESYEVVEMDEPQVVSALSIATEEIVKDPNIPKGEIADRVIQFKKDYEAKEGKDANKPFAYSVRLKYRANNRFGAKVLDEVNVYLDTTKTKVMGVKPYGD